MAASGKEVEKHMNSAMQDAVGVLDDEKNKEENKPKGKRGFKRQRPASAAEKAAGALMGEGKKRDRQLVEEMDIDDERKWKFGKTVRDASVPSCANVEKAGPVDRSCEQGVRKRPDSG